MNDEKERLTVFPVGEKNDAFAQYFIGQSYLHMLSTEQVAIGNVTFEPGCRNNWHIHHAKSGGGQILLVTAGRGFLFKKFCHKCLQELRKSACRRSGRLSSYFDFIQ